MTPIEIIDFIKQCKDMGLASVEVEGIKVEFITNGTKSVPVSIKDDIEDIKHEDLMTPQSPYDVLSDDEVLFWSTDYGVELQDEKERDLQRKEEIKNGDQFK